MTRIPAAMRTYLRSKIHDEILVMTFQTTDRPEPRCRPLERAGTRRGSARTLASRQILVDAKNRFVRNL